ncbi:MAG: rhomboid family intramembrane serine protease [Bacilli bacterium]|nr:rhomboid family intramembrane serine protease [Bacilli bacterium]
MGEIINYFEYNAPVTLTFFLISFGVLILSWIFKKQMNYLFSSERASLLNPLTWIRFFTNILGHKDFGHFSNNFLKILLLGPMIEEKYGSINLLIMILITAFITGVINFIIGKYRIMGASNIVFMLIALSAFANMSDRIPLTLVFIILFYFIDELRQIFRRDGVAHYGHLIGALSGVAFGFICNNTSLIDLLTGVFK